MNLTKKHVGICINEGFARAWLEERDGETVLLAERDNDGHDTMIFRPDGRAWMLVGPAGMKSPKAITEPHGDGRSPVKSFASVREAAQHASSGIYY